MAFALHAVDGGVVLDGAGILAPLVVVSIAAVVHVALGGGIASSPAAGQVPLAVINLFAVLLVGGPLGEEFGWRGYALPHLQTRMGWRPASLMLGLVWGLWHLPLFFISDTVQAHMTLALFLPSTVAMSVIFGWLALHTRGSVALRWCFTPRSATGRPSCLCCPPRRTSGPTCWWW